MHEHLTRFAQFWGTFYIALLFALAVVYALWPSNRSTFDHAARAPLEPEDDDADEH
jgi:cytochrome c oxidase cbb3-type subunit 4